MPYPSPRPVDALSLKRRFYDKGMGRRLVLPHRGRVGGRRCLENIGVDTLAFEKAVRTLLVPDNADDAPESSAETAPQGRTLVRGQYKRLQGFEGEIHLCGGNVDSISPVKQDKSFTDSTTYITR